MGRAMTCHSKGEVCAGERGVSGDVTASRMSGDGRRLGGREASRGT